MATITRVVDKRILRTEGSPHQFFQCRVQVVDQAADGTETIIEEEFFHVDLDTFPVTQAQLQARLDARKAALKTRAANRQALNLDLLS